MPPRTPDELRAHLTEVPGLTPGAIDGAVLYAQQTGRNVYAYTSGEDWVLWIEMEYPLESRWSVPAWNTWVAGGHSTEERYPCMCRMCQENRYRLAHLAYIAALEEKQRREAAAQAAAAAAPAEAEEGGARE